DLSKFGAKYTPPLSPFMLSRRRIARIRSLHRKKERYRHAAFLVEGEKNVRELLASRNKVEFVTGLPDRLKELEHERGAGTPFIESDQPSIQSCSTLQHPEGILAIAKIPDRPWDPKKFSPNRPWLFFESLSDPGNLGTLLRVGEHFGLEGLLLSSDSVDPYNPKVVRSSMGSLFRQEVQEKAGSDVIRDAREQGRPVIATSSKAPSLYKDPPARNSLLLFGSESQGLSPSLVEEADDSRSLPSLGDVESLNVAVSAAIFCSELLRADLLDP
ncbi:MAG: TrmH family RNA methyltransferase, partial [Flavobacteriales bacterium]